MLTAETREALTYAVAQLRHAYHNLIGPEGAWDRNQRMRFADGLIAPQIVAIEEVLASLSGPQGQWQLQCSTCEAWTTPLEANLRTFNERRCGHCGGGFLAPLQADQPARQWSDELLDAATAHANEEVGNHIKVCYDYFGFRDALLAFGRTLLKLPAPPDPTPGR